MPAQDYPLKWPQGWPRTTTGMRRSAPYKTSLEAAAKELVADIGRMRGRDITVSSNLRAGLGKKMTESEVRDPGVAVYWTDKNGHPRVMACDHWYRLRDNVRAIGLTIGALRQIERCGATGMLDRALDGFKALPAAPDCWELLGIPKGSIKAEIRDRFRELSATRHPDRGGDSQAFAQITGAYHEAMGCAP